MRNVKTVVGFMAVFGPVIVLGGCQGGGNDGHEGQTTKPTQAVEVRIGTFSKALDYGPYMVAKSQGLFEKGAKEAGLSASFSHQEYQALPPLNEALSGGKVDMVLAAEVPLLVGKASGIDTKLVKQVCTLTVGIMVPVNSPVKQVSQLRGKRIAVLAGTGVHYGLMSILSKVGMGKDDVKIVDMPPPDAKAAFETGQVDAWIVWPPFPEELVLAGKARMLPNAEAQVQVLLAARREFINAHRDAMGVVLKAFDQGRAWIKEHPAEAKSAFAKDLGMSGKVVESAWPRENWSTSLDAFVVRDIQSKADFLSQSGMVSSKINVGQDFVGNVSVK